MLSIITAIFVTITTPQLPLSSATTDDALAILGNPAGLGIGRTFNCYYLYNFSNYDDLNQRQRFWDNQTFLFQINTLGFAYVDLKDYRIGWGSKISDAFAFGITYRKLNEKHYWDAGLLSRPLNYLSLGAMLSNIGQATPRQLLFGIGVRPLTNRLTLTFDVFSDNWRYPTFGVELEPINGVEIRGKFSRNQIFSIQAGVNLHKVGIGAVHNSSFNTGSSYHHWAGYLRFDIERRRSLIAETKKFLEMRLSGIIADQKPGFSIFGSNVNYTTYEILNTFKKAKEDSQITGIVLKLENVRMNFAIAQEIKSALNECKKNKKKIIVYSPYFDNLTYYLASGADQIISHPLGEVDIPGLVAKSMFIKDALDKIGIEVEYERVGKYKSAPEMLTEDTLSLANREVINAILDDLYQQLTKTISQERNFSEQEITDKINRGFFLAKNAKQERLIDNLCYEDELDSLCKNIFAHSKPIPMKKYLRQLSHQYDWQAPPKIVIIYANGDIAIGESSTDPLTGNITCGANTIVCAIRQARKDKKVKAIVLRVNSPGGDGFASDLIWREIQITKKTKPVIVSMGPLAASGGYYIAMNGDKIFALPATITGSIGVFGLKYVTKELYHKLGINIETIKRGEHADAFSPDRKFSPDEKMILKKQVEDFYAQFIEKVAQARNLSVDYVDSVGQGRIWTGNQAKERFLIDSLGGLLNAVEFAKEKTKVKEVKIDFLPRPKRDFFNLALKMIVPILKYKFYE
ncbi:MAG: signal peptide peptidase SppA [candidate division WOR-3 bacterium]